MTGFRSAWARGTWLLAALLAPGCGTTPESADCRVCSETRILSTVDGWQPVPAIDDPFATHRPDELRCPDFGYGVEGGFFEVNTGECNYGTFAQPLQYPIAEGDDLAFVFTHLALWGPDGAHAHIAVQIGADVVWEQDLALPVQANTTTVGVPVEGFVDAGENAYFHVHNHGSNSYRMGDIRAIPPGG